ncbi:hypothetical protein [Endozoicomonas sp. SESOKO1]|uniref:DUF7694 domain-containing protein n=1 Tax=Endozoicomonas sp. SESOKO1 TaxID=2828742 RepID=UPI0021498E3F|nr:hypothetical protein [Endozoicomonas sp. SESOKO1]
MSRTKPQQSAAKKLLGKPKGKLEPIDFNQYPAPDWMTRAYRNHRYVVMIEDGVAMSNGATAIKVMVQRHDDKPIPNHWREMQNIKDEIFGSEALGVEYYPPEEQLTDKANIYWLWIFPAGGLPVACITKTR